MLRRISPRWSYSLRSLAEASDPFHDPKDPLDPKDFRFDNDLDDARLVRGQLASYAAAYMGSQFRIHTFTVFICG
jgi:hypothetical protein